MKRFWDKVNKRGPISNHRPDLGRCWIWISYTNSRGYGKFMLNGKSQSAHRVAFKLIIGEVPVGKELDHLCRVKNCVNPEHLNPVTHKENMTAPGALVGIPTGQKKKEKTRCPSRHPYSGDNLYITNEGYRQCKACNRIRQEKKKMGTHNRDKTHCPYGHTYSGDNIYYRKNGSRQCRACVLKREKLKRTEKSSL